MRTTFFTAALLALVSSARANNFGYGSCDSSWQPLLSDSDEIHDFDAYDYQSNGNSQIVTPIQNPSVDRQDYQNLVPSRDASLFYGQTGPRAQYAAILNFTMDYPTIVTEDSAYISECSCADSTIELTFSSAEAFEYAKRWPQDSFVLITNAAGCSSQQDERGVFLINKVELKESTLVVRCDGMPKKWEEVSETLEIGFGPAKPGAHAGAVTTRTATRYFTANGIVTSTTYLTTITPMQYSTSIVASSVRSTSIPDASDTTWSQWAPGHSSSMRSTGATSTTRTTQSSSISAYHGYSTSMTARTQGYNRTSGASSATSDSTTTSTHGSSSVSSKTTVSTTRDLRSTSGYTNVTTTVSTMTGYSNATTTTSGTSQLTTTVSSTTGYFNATTTTRGSSEMTTSEPVSTTSETSLTTSETTSTSTTTAVVPGPTELSEAERVYYNQILDVLQVTDEGYFVLPLPDNLRDYQAQFQVTAFDPTDEAAQAALLEKLNMFGFDSGDDIDALTDAALEEAASQSNGLTPEMGVSFPAPSSFSEQITKRTWSPTRRMIGNRYHKGVPLRDIATKRSNAKRGDDDWWVDLGFSFLGFLGEVGCEPCGLAADLKDLYDGIQDLKGAVEYLLDGMPAQAEGQLTGSIDITVPYQTLVTKSDGNKVICNDASFKVSYLFVETKMVVRLKDNVVVAGEVSTSMDTRSNLQLQLDSVGPTSGYYEFTTEAVSMDALEAPGVFKIVPRLMYNFGIKYTMNFAGSIKGGAYSEVNQAQSNVNIVSHQLNSYSNWRPSRIDLAYPSFNVPQKATMKPYLKTVVSLSIDLFGYRHEDAVSVETQTWFAYDASVLTAKESDQCLNGAFKLIATLDNRVDMSLWQANKQNLDYAVYPLGTQCWGGQPDLVTTTSAPTTPAVPATTTTTTTQSTTTTTTTSAGPSTPTCSDNLVGNAVATDGTTYTAFYRGCGRSLQGGLASLAYLPRQASVRWEKVSNWSGYTFTQAVANCATLSVSLGSTLIEFYEDSLGDWYCVSVVDTPADATSFKADGDVINIWGFAIEGATPPLLDQHDGHHDDPNNPPTCPEGYTHREVLNYQGQRNYRIVCGKQVDPETLSRGNSAAGFAGWQTFDDCIRGCTSMGAGWCKAVVYYPNADHHCWWVGNPYPDLFVITDRSDAHYAVGMD